MPAEPPPPAVTGAVVGTRRRHLLVALADPGFRRLFAVRLASQFGDGVFQASLAGAVLFNPDRQADAADVAAGFAVLLLPYSLAGPFAGVLLDRWTRRRILLVANVVRALALLAFAGGVAGGLAGPGFYAAALLLLSIGRFVLSALSAGLPHVVPSSELVTANAASTTAGTLAAAVGGLAAVGVRSLVGAGDTGNAGYAVIAAAAAVPYLLAAAGARGFAGPALGPSAHERASRESARDVVRGLLAGAAHLRARPGPRNGLLLIGAHRLGYGITLVCTVLLYRNYLAADGVFRAGLAGLSQVVAMVAAGGALAALVTPVAFRRLGPVRWPIAVLVLAAAVELGLVLTYRLPLLTLSALPLAFAAQAIKITVDTLVQRGIDDAYRGRVFAIYDALFNVTLVVAAVLTATVLPEDGRSPVSVVVIAVGYLAVAAAYGLGSRATSAAARTTP